MQLRRHQSARDSRIFLHELSRCVFIGRLKDGNTKCLVASVLFGALLKKALDIFRTQSPF
jgi:hypothetical protein